MAGTNKILVIDDESALLKIIGRFLSKMEFQADLAESGSEGITKFKGDPVGYKGVVIDYSLPEMPCKDIIGQIRALNSDIKIILSTGFSAKELKNEKDLAVDDTLQKPFTFDDFKEVIKRNF